MRDVLRDREFLAYVVARQSSWLAYSLESTAVFWQIYSIRHHAFDLGLVGLILFVPQLALALPAGVLADRYDRRRICAGVAATEFAMLCVFVWLALSGSRSLWSYFTAIVVIGTVHAIGTPAERSLLANIVRPHHFVRAAALSSTIGQLITIGGPALAGLLLAIAAPWAFASAAIFYAVASFGFLFLRERASTSDNLPLWNAAVEGIRFIMQRQIILGAISLDLFAVLFGGATALLPIYASQILHVGAAGFGILRAAPAVGAAVVAAYIARRAITSRAGALLFGCVAGFGVFTIVFGLSRNFWLSFAALALTGGFDMVSVVIRNALVQLGTPDGMRGRVSAVENVFIGASNELGAFESGAVAALIGAEGSVVLGGIATLLVIVLWAFVFPALPRFDRLVKAPSRG